MQKDRWRKWIWIGAALALAGILALPLKRYDCVLIGLPLIETANGRVDAALRGNDLYLVDFPRDGVMDKVASTTTDSKGNEIWETPYGKPFSLKFFVWGVLLTDENGSSGRYSIGWRKWGS